MHLTYTVDVMWHTNVFFVSCSYHSFCNMTLHLILFTAGRNNDLLKVHIDTANLSNSFVECTFQPEYTCTIHYGTNSSYTNLHYRDISSTQGRVTTITLSQELRGDTTYYYIVSAENSFQCVKVWGEFRAGKS